MKTLLFTLTAALLLPSWTAAANKRPTERQAANVFRAYDKNRDSVVTVDEWLQMRHLTAFDKSSRANVERARFKAAEPSGDGRMTQKEFVYWYAVGRFSGASDRGGPSAEGNGIRRGPRDGEGGAPIGARDGEGGVRRGPRDGEGGVRKGPGDGEGAARVGARDGEAVMRRGARDGEGGIARGPRDGEGGAPRGPRDGEGGAPRGPRDGEGGRSAEGGDGLNIFVNTTGQVMVNGRVLSPSQRFNYLRQLAQNSRGRKIYLRPSRGTSAGQLQAVIGECQRVGMKNLYMGATR